MLPLKGIRQKLLSGFFFAKGVPSLPPTPYPLAENHFAKKPLAEIGGTAPHPPKWKVAEKFPKTRSKRVKINVFGQK